MLRLIFPLIFSATFAFANHGNISIVKKQAWITKKGRQEVKARRGMTISSGDKIRTGPESYVKILMNDKNTFHVGPNSEMELKAYNSKTDEVTESSINVIYGRVRSALGKKYDGKKSKFKVDTEAAILGVRGTDFVTTFAKASKTAKTVVFEGQVQAQGIDSAGNLIGEQLVSPGQMTTVVKGMPPTLPVKIPLDMLKSLDSLSISAQEMPIDLPDTGSNSSGSSDSESAENKEAKEESKEKPPEPEPTPAPKPDQSAEQDSDSDQDDSGNMELAFKVGTLGASIDFSYPLSKDFHIKFDAYKTVGAKYKRDQAGEGYEGELDFSGLGILGQWGSSGAFQLIFGAYFVQNKLSVTGTPFGNEAIGNTNYDFSAGNTLSGAGKFKNSVAPYAGIGWQLGILGLFDIVGDIGVLSIGKLEVEKLEYQGPTVISKEDVAAEIKEVETEADKIKLYPVVRLGLSFEF